MLTDAERLRIRDEEIFREEVRRDLLKSTPIKTSTVAGRIWDFFNTSVGGWILTTVLAGFVVWFATTLKEEIQASREATATRNSVRREVAFRLWAAESVENPDQARDKLDEVYIEPQYQEWDFGAVLFKLADISDSTPELLDEVMHFKAKKRPGENFHTRLAELRQRLEKNELIEPLTRP